MKRLRKSNSVSWANDSSLCQVRLFVSEDSPSQVEIPPGFERPNLTCIGRVPWNCPPKFGLSHNWNVVAGEESQEVEVQELRESRVFEAFYPSSSVIPANSSVSMDVEREFYDDSLTPTVPIIPIEEEEETESVPSLPEPAPNSSNSQPSSLNQDSLPSSIPNSVKCNAPAQQAEPAPGVLPIQTTCLITAAAMAVMKSKEQESFVDTNLLIKILSDPKMVSNLAKDFPKSAISADEQIVISKPVAQLPPTSFPNPASGSTPFPPGRNSDSPHRASQPSSPTPSWSKPAIAAERDAFRVSGATPTVGNLISIPKQVQTNPNPFAGSGLISNQPKTMAKTCIKDLNYFKNLIREHGTDKTQEPYPVNMGLRTVSTKFQKACMYFKTPMGCWKGSNCPYKHDFSNELKTGMSLEAPLLKRMRINGEINW